MTQHQTDPALQDGARSRTLEVPLDLRKYVAIFRRRLGLFVSVALLVFVGAVVVTIQTTPGYTATAKLMLDREEQRVTDVEAVVSGVPADSAAVDTEVEILRSRRLADRVVTALDLAENPEFNAALREPRGLEAVLRGIGRLFSGAAPAARRAQRDAAEAQKSRERVIDAVLKGVQVRRAGVTYVIELNFTSADPQTATLIANTYADRYLLEQLEGRYEATRQANLWLNDRLATLRAEVGQAEAAVEQYRTRNNLLSASGATLTEQEISTYNQQLAAVRATQAEEEARLSTARSQLAQGSSGDDVGEALGSTVVQSLRAQRVQLSARLAEAQQRYGPRHPELLQSQRQIADIDAQIQQEIQRIVSNLEARVAVARQRTTSMTGSLGQARGTLAANNAANVRLNELQRNAEAVRTLYESYLNRFQETSSQEGLARSDARVVSRAQIPDRPSSPDVPANLLIGLIAAVGLGLAAVVLSERLDSGLVTAADVESRLGVPHLGAVPALRSVADPGERDIRPADYLLARPMSAFAEAVRGLRTSIVFARVGEASRVVAVTSALPGEGKTTTAVCLARSVAQAGGSVLLVDCDLRRHSLGDLLDLDPAAGLLEVLNQTATLDEVLIQDQASGAWILPLAHNDFTPRDVFGSEPMKRLIAALKDRFELILLDTAPVLAVSDTRVLVSQTDVVVVLARWRKTPEQAVEMALRLIEQAGGEVAGVALSQVNIKQQARYGHGDAGYYFGAYKAYYAS